MAGECMRLGEYRHAQSSNKPLNYRRFPTSQILVVVAL